MSLLGRGLFTLGAVAALGTAIAVRPPRQGVWVRGVPALAQELPHSCGAAALRMVLARFGHFVPEATLRAELGTAPSHGTSHERMTAGARARGLVAQAKTGVGVEALRSAVRRCEPTIVALQAWGNTERYRDAESGHYVVLAGYAAERFFFLDPWDGQVHELTEAAFLERWHDVDSSGTPVRRLALFFREAKAGRAPLAFDPMP